MKPLDYYAQLFRTDKASWGHDYANAYDEVFGHLRDQPVTILELGIKFGSSIRMWEEGFPKAKVVAVDRINKIRGSVRPVRAHLHFLDLSDASALRALAEEHGPFDIVIDDSAHRSEITHNIIHTLWPTYIKPGGWLVIEDTNSGYKTDRTTGLPIEEAHDHVDYCATLVKNVNHSGKLSRCGPNYWELSSEFDKAIRQLIYRPGLMFMERRK